MKCSVEECGRRDPKRLYHYARESKTENFTGINHPFQEPNNSDIVVDTDRQILGQCVEHVFDRFHELNRFGEETGVRIRPESLRKRWTSNHDSLTSGISRGVNHSRRECARGGSFELISEERVGGEEQRPVRESTDCDQHCRKESMVDGKRRLDCGDHDSHDRRTPYL